MPPCEARPDPAPHRWRIADLLPRIACPVLAVQGHDDVCGTMAQVDGVAARVPGTRLLTLPHCGHSPHRDCPDAVVAATRELLDDVAGEARPASPALRPSCSPRA